MNPPARPKRKRFEFPQCLPVKRIEYPLPEEERICPCGCGQRAVIREQTTRQLEYQSSSAYVAEHVRYTYGCPKGREGELIVTSEKPPSVNEKGVFGPSVVAWLAQSKFERHLPLYRLQEELQSASQMWFSRSVLSGALLRTAAQLRPLTDLIRRRLLESFYVRADETTARVLRPGTGKTGLVYLWIYVGDQQHPYQLFDYRLDRTRAGPQEILGEYQGGLLSDGHSAYTALINESEGRLLDLGCWAHARRKFDESCAVTSHPLAEEALAWTWLLYDIEDRLADATAEVRQQVRMRRIAGHRSTSPQQLTKLLRGDLDWILCKSLEPDRSRRYQTAADFSSDVRRYLRGGEIAAGPPSVLERVSKYFSRYKATIAITATALLALAAGLAIGWIVAS